jgi:hypothetical protein
MRTPSSSKRRLDLAPPLADRYAVLSSTPGNANPIFRIVSKLIALLGMSECDYPQEQAPFQDTERAKPWRRFTWRSKRDMVCL